MPDTPKSVDVTPPLDPVKGSTKTQYRWDVEEGFFALTRASYEHRTFTTDAEVAELVNIIKGLVGKTAETKLISEKPLSQGKWRGADMVFKTGDWIKTCVRVMVAGNEAYTLTATVDHNITNAEILLIKAMDSLAPSEQKNVSEKTEKTTGD